MADVMEIYKNAAGKWGWRLVATNGNIVATDGHQGYENKETAIKMGASVKDGAWKAAQIVEVDGS